MVGIDGHGRPRGINSEGLKRRGFDAERISAIKRAYRTLYVAGVPLAEAKQQLAEQAQASDNVTVVALEWETPDAFESTQGVSTDSISDDVFASTIQAGPLDGLADDLDDAAIERSIAEINEAIRRSAARRG